MSSGLSEIELVSYYRKLLKLMHHCQPTVYSCQASNDFYSVFRIPGNSNKVVFELDAPTNSDIIKLNDFSDDLENYLATQRIKTKALSKLSDEEKRVLGLI